MIKKILTKKQPKLANLLFIAVLLLILLGEKDKAYSRVPPNKTMVKVAQTFLDIYYPDCEYSKHVNDYDVSGRYMYTFSVRGKVLQNDVEKDFLMYFKFTDKDMNEYYLESFRVGNDYLLYIP